MVIRKIIGIGVPLITLNLGVGLARYVSYEREKEKEFLNISLSVIIFFSLLNIIFFFVFRNSLSLIFFNTTEYDIFVVLIAFFLSSSGIYNLSYAFFRGRQEINKSNEMRILYNLFSIILGLMLWKIFKNQYSEILYFYIFMYPILVIVLGLWYLRHNIFLSSILKFKEKLQSAKYFFFYSFSRIPSGIFLALIFGVPVFIASREISLVAAGYVGIAISIVRLMEIFTTPFNLIFLPKFAEIGRRNDTKEINQKISIVVNFIITAVPFFAIICYGLTRYIIIIFFTNKYVVAVQSTSVVILFSTFYISYVLLRGILDGLYSFPYVNIICLTGFLVTTASSFLFHKNIFMLALDYGLGLFVLGMMALYILIKKAKIFIQAKELLMSLFSMLFVFIILFYLDKFVEFIIFNEYSKLGIMVVYRIILVLSLYLFYWKPKTLWFKELKHRVIILKTNANSSSVLTK